MLLVAPPASGKTTFALTYVVPRGYLRASLDDLKTKAKCLRVVKEALAAGKSVIVDNTSPSDETRALYVNIARECPRGAVPVRCIMIETDVELAHHLNAYREKKSEGARRHVPTIAYNLYRKNWVEPDADREGFAAPVLRVPFQPHFGSAADREK